ncbi:BRO-like protein [Armadillidium vulgare iridescent virus]|uniref:BRO-like protein n=1 Tax=Armadillidium vulgare iridescent virus TaxID=72201 RepID=A0A068QLP9_9VIRU|nr:BRO-like protein [Armadillidium vulgare iridescent virus]CCV02459.1 BRO-like protein [Armadillidium vulgare iridescent virus]
MEVVKTFNFDIENNIMIVNNVKITVVGNYETPWFSGKEMCEALGYQNSKKTLLTNVKTKHKITLEDLRKLGPTGCPNSLWSFADLSYHEGKAVYISEHGAYHLAMKCKLPIGDSFRDWLAEEVIPTLRKKGHCQMIKEKDDQLTESMSKLAIKEEEFTKEKLAREELQDILLLLNKWFLSFKIEG